MPVTRIAMYLPSASGGGAERLVVNLAGFFLARGLAVTILMDRAEGPLLGSIPKGATVVSFGNPRVWQSVTPLARYLRTARPDILVSNLEHNNIVAIWAAMLARVRTTLVVTQHNMLSAQARRGGTFRLLPALHRMFLARADGIVTVSAGIADDLAAVTKVARGRITVIHNGVVTDDFESKAAAGTDHPFFTAGVPVFVAVGRLVPQKDFPTLLGAFARLVRDRPARLIILGEGPLRADLEGEVRKLDLADRVALPGYVLNPLPLMRAASAVVLSSRFEGFAIMLAEALACGTPVVSTDCPHGPAEILERGRFGPLVPVGDPDALAAAMLAVLDRPLPADTLRDRGRVFSVETCGTAYLDLFERLTVPA